MSETSTTLPPGTSNTVLERRRQHPFGPLLRLKGIAQAVFLGVVAGGSGCAR